MKRNWLFLLLISIAPMIFFACSKDNSTTALVGNWTKKTEIMGVGRSGAVCFTIGDYAYVGLGYNQTVNAKYYHNLSDFYRYDYNNNQWLKIASLPNDTLSRTEAVAFSVNNKGYVGTGYDGNNYLSDFWEYNPANDTWKMVARLPIGGNLVAGRRGAVAFGLGNYGFVGTGYNGSYLNDFWKFTPNSDTGRWDQVANLPFKRAFGTSFVIRDSAYVVCGDESGTESNDFYKYDLTNDKWIQLKPIANVSTQSYDDNYNIVRSYGVGFSANGLGYVASGSRGVGLTQDVWEYDATTDLWTQRTSFEGSARMEPVGFSINNNIFVGTGKSGTNAYDDFWQFKPTQAYDPNN